MGEGLDEGRWVKGKKELLLWETRIENRIVRLYNGYTMRMPTAYLEGEKLPRVIFSIKASGHQEILALMKKAYEMGAWSFDLPSSKHLESFKELKHFTDDETLIGLGHLDAEEGASFFGRPLHQFESKVVSTIKRNIIPPQIHHLFSGPKTSEIFTQKETDRISFDTLRFEKALSRFDPQLSPFLLLGEKYSDWLLALGRIDLLKEMVEKVRGKSFIPIFSGQWATFILPKAKPLDVAAFAVPINKRWSYFDLTHACDRIKKFDKPVISLNPLADGQLLREAEEAFLFLFEGLKIHSAIVEVASEEEVKRIFAALEKIPSLIPPRKA